MSSSVSCCALLILIGATAVTSTLAADPDRARGVSIHLLPKRVADLSAGTIQWGLNTDFSEFLKPEPAKPVFQNSDALIVFLKKQSSQVKENGVWIVLSNPRAYTAVEAELMDSVKAACRKNGIALFTIRAKDLDNRDGWVRD